jgi:hypothetical protein
MPLIETGQCPTESDTGSRLPAVTPRSGFARASSTSWVMPPVLPCAEAGAFPPPAQELRRQTNGRLVL